MKLSIITINLNNASGLEKTITSVLKQSYSDIEYIVIDGESDDGSVDVIKQFQDRISYWLSEKDSGIYNAMNKGIQQATGEYILFLNSGDYLINNAVLENVFDQTFNEDLISGNIQTDKEKWTSLSELTLEKFLTRPLPHPASFIKKDLFGKFGLYNEKLKILSDFEFFLKCILNNCTYRHLETTITWFDLSGISTKQRKLKNIEKNDIILEHVVSVPIDVHEYLRNQKDLTYYRSSKLVMLIKKLQTSAFYRRLRKN